MFAPLWFSCLTWQNKLTWGQLCLCLLSVYPHLWAKVSLTVQSKGAGEPFSDQSERPAPLPRELRPAAHPFPQAAGS